MCSVGTAIYKCMSQIWAPSSPTKLGVPKHHNFGQISDNFATWSRISPESNTEIGITNCDHSSTWELILWSNLETSAPKPPPRRYVPVASIRWVHVMNTEQCRGTYDNWGLYLTLSQDENDYRQLAAFWRDTGVAGKASGLLQRTQHMTCMVSVFAE